MMHERKGILVLMKGKGPGPRWRGWPQMGRENAELQAFWWLEWWEDQAVGLIVPMFSL